MFIFTYQIKTNMKRIYILLASIYYDINAEYSHTTQDVYLGAGKFNSKEEAEIEARKLLEEMASLDYEIYLSESESYVKELNL